MATFVGLMSGTSLDGIDAVVVDFADGQPGKLGTLASACMPIPDAVRERILRLCSPGNHEIDAMGELDSELGTLFAAAATEVIRSAGLRAEDIVAIGSHGQTIRHRPAGTHPFTLQIGDPNTIAELTGITTVADFRRRDVAAGGQGAPLVPAFHAWMFRSADISRAILNIGGMANLTVLPANPSVPVLGFDTGPGNVLLDAWHAKHQGIPIDMNGGWARTGQADTSLLEHLLSERFFISPPPKSTGRELFNLHWLEEALTTTTALKPQDVQATLAELTAVSCAEGVKRWAGEVGELFLCGGGAHNIYLRERIAQHLPDVHVTTTSELGLDPDWVEAVAFAWLARQTIAGLPGNLPAVTGAGHPVVLGGIYQASRPLAGSPERG
jgi:anhydro-N-acetylmuramic acid kinase